MTERLNEIKKPICDPVDIEPKVEGKRKTKKRRSQLEITVHNRILFAEVGEPVLEHRFHPTRKWRFDFAFPDKMIAVEAEGAAWAGGRHTRGGGFIKDSEKYNEAVMLGWRVLRYTTGTVGRIIPDLRRIFDK